MGKAVCCLLAVLLLAATTWATDATKAQGLTLTGSPTIVIDVSAGTGSRVVDLRNESDASVMALLSAGPLTQVGNTKTSDATVMFSAESDTGAGAPDYQFSLQPRAAGRVRVIVSNLWEAGQFEAELRNNGVTIGKLGVRSYPVNVKIDSPVPGETDLNLVSGVRSRLYLKNDDPVSYDMSYQLLIGGRHIAGKDFTIRPNGTVIVEFEPSIPIDWYDPQWYLSRFQDLFKPQSGPDDVLLLYLRQSGQAASAASPIKRIPIKGSINFFAPTPRAALSYLIIVVLLTLGGLSSLILSHLLPNRLQKLDIKEQLESLARTTANLSSHVGSRLGVVVRVERSRLYDLLTSRSTISPDFAGVIAQCTQGVATLSTRIGMLQQMDLVVQRLADLLPLGVPPTQVDQIEANLGKAAIFLGKDAPTASELQSAQTAITDSASGVDTLGRANPAFGQDLADRVRAIVNDTQTNFAARPTFVRITRILPGPYAILRAVPGAGPVSADQYTDADMALAKLGLMREYVQLAEGTMDAAMVARLSAAEPRLLGFLQLDTWDALRSARLLVREMQGDVYPQRLQQALAASPPEASITMEPPFAYERQPLSFKVEFHSQSLDSAAAREEWSCNWDFGDGLSERGWSVSHYFLIPRAKLFRRRLERLFTIMATFQDADGRSVVDPTTGQRVQVSREVTVHPSTLARLLGERTLTEGIRLGAALLIAVFGLVAGARDQLLKLDILPGLVAVFLVGFGADTIKNLLTVK